MSRMITGSWISQLVYVTAKLKLADLVAIGPRTSEELAGLTDTQPDMMYRVLRALASIGIFEGKRIAPVHFDSSCRDIAI